MDWITVEKQNIKLIRRDLKVSELICYVTIYWITSCISAWLIGYDQFILKSDYSKP